MINNALSKFLRRKDRVVVHGVFGKGNLGDECILAAIRQQFSAMGGIDAVVFSKNPVEIRAKHNLISVNPNAKHGITGYLSLLGASVYILGGGGLIKDYGESPRDLEKWLHWLRISRRLGVRTMMWSVGVENLLFRKSRERVRKVLNKVDAIIVRDPNSKKRLEEVGVKNQIWVTADPTLLLTTKERKQRSLGNKMKVVVCLRHWYQTGFFVPDTAVQDRMLSGVASTLDRLRKNHNADIHLVPMRTVSFDDDRKMFELLVQKMGAPHSVTIHPDTPAPDAFIRILSGSTLVIGMRLHSIILATSLGVPSIALSYMPKVRDYMSYIEQDNLCLDVEDVDGKQLWDKVQRVLIHYHEISGRLIDVSFELESKLSRNMENLSRLLNKDNMSCP